MFAARLSVGFILLAAALTARAEQVVVTINEISASGVGAPIGTVTLSDGPSGLVIQPNLKQLAPGEHGFHVHTNPDCGAANDAAGMAAGRITILRSLRNISVRKATGILVTFQRWSWRRTVPLLGR